ncbi:hypothetical protein ATORI0001_0890 [Lancefieldella rimae ATCC 49626]|uniref:Uncharacterized protein n=1 Tax=Lancefieldella rimae (strain ATCC 49626 / DSM 7090 / CCUG 31168 / NBRC 15546 / VPI D140H-11A) TaxID=553184 RepID=B9CMT2_LANR4|nr:hypothetical protein ATORI0001_0890 [Lancefieldella rimae ATCC 49626]
MSREEQEAYMPTDSKSYTILLANTSCLIRTVVTVATQQF